jgi:hypothetical protein
VLENLYWFKKNQKGYRSYKLEQAVKFAIQRIGWERFKVALKQTFHTINGLLIKKFMSFGPELVGYKRIADHTAKLFRDLIREYSIDFRMDLIVPSAYEDIKDFFNFVKEWHEHPAKETRISVLNYEFKTSSLGSFFGREMAILKATIENHKNQGLGDYTQSIAWDFRCVSLCQTRSIGFLPPFKKRERRKEFQVTISREPKPLSKERTRMIRDLTIKELANAKLPRSYSDEDGLDLGQIVEESVHMEIKPSADVNFTMYEGGTLEDARMLLSMIRAYNWRAPIRNLETFEVTGYTTRISDDISINENVYNLSSTLFWFALQHGLNHLICKGAWPRRNDYFPFLKPGGHEDNPESHFVVENYLDAQILDIDEGGKLRKLVKCHAYFNWALAPGSKISQKVLARMPDHTAGLEAGAHDWVFTKRIGGTSSESGFLYNLDGRVKESSVFGYMDWTEATDKMWKRIGIAHLRAFFDYIRFPRLYGIFIMTAIREPQRVKEIHQITVTPDETIKDIIQWNGYINEGFMMGNRMTKTILHLAHTSEKAFAQAYLEQKGIRVLGGTPNLDDRGYGIPYSAEDSVGTFH